MLTKKEKIKASELRVERIDEAHKEKISDFQSYEDELVDFLVEDALTQQNRRISSTYLWFLRSNDALVAYITLTPDCVKLKNIDQSLAEEFRDKGINYKSLPALKIGRLCVDDRFLRKGIGKLLIQFAIKMAIDMSKKTGCRFLYLDAKRNKDNSKDVIHFYKKMEFKLYKDRNQRETPMYLDLWGYMGED